MRKMAIISIVDPLNFLVIIILYLTRDSDTLYLLEKSSTNNRIRELRQHFKTVQKIFLVSIMKLGF